MKPPTNNEPRMKPSEARPAEPPAAVATAPAPSSLAETTPVTAPLPLPPDYAARRLALEQQKAALQAEETRLRKVFFDDHVSQAKGMIKALLADGHDLASIGKALGFTHRLPRPASAQPSTSSKGPTSNAGWFASFRSRAIQAYLRQHPDVAQTLKSRGMPPSQYATDIPSADLAVIDADAQRKADAKCPRDPATK